MNINPINITTNNNKTFKAKSISKPVIHLAKEDEFLSQLIHKNQGMILKFMELYKISKLTLARKVAPDKLVKLPFYQENYGTIFVNSGTRTTSLDLNKLVKSEIDAEGFAVKNLEAKIDKNFLTTIYDNIRLNYVIPKKGLSVKI